MKDRRQEQTPSVVPERAPQDGEIRARWAWVETVVWTERMLATLETGIEGGKWFRLIDKVWSPKKRTRTWNRSSTMAKCLLHRGGLVLLKTSACCGLPIFLKANHQLESRVPEIGLLGSEGGATSSVVPTPILCSFLFSNTQQLFFSAKPIVEGRSAIGRFKNIKCTKRDVILQHHFRGYEGFNPIKGIRIVGGSTK